MPLHDAPVVAACAATQTQLRLLFAGSMKGSCCAKADDIVASHRAAANPKRSGAFVGDDIGPRIHRSETELLDRVG